MLHPPFRSAALSAFSFWSRVALALLFASACATTPRGPATSARRAPTFQVTPQIVAANVAGTPTEIFDLAKRRFVEEKFPEAADLFDLVQRGDPDGPLAALAAQQGAFCYERRGQWDEALRRDDLVLMRYAGDPISKQARKQRGRALVGLERWTDLRANGEALLARSDLTILDLVEGDGERALALVETGETDKARRLVGEARTRMEQHHLGESGAIPSEVTQVFYALGEIYRVESERILFDPPPSNFGQSFERRAQGLLDAQSAFTDAMRTMDPTWATMAGYRVGSLYATLHRDVMAARPPAVAQSERDKVLFEGAMRLRYRVLLRKGLQMMDATVRMNDRVGDQGVWTARARAAKSDIERALAEQNAALAKLPVAESELQKRLDELQEKTDQRSGKRLAPKAPWRGASKTLPLGLTKRKLSWPTRRGIL